MCSIQLLLFHDVKTESGEDKDSLFSPALLTST